MLHAAALQHVLAGRHLEALVSCKQALAMDPENPETMNLMALVHTEAKQFDHAVEWASRAIGKDAKPQYLTTLGTALLKSGRREEAITTFDKAVQLRPGDAVLWWQSALLLGPPITVDEDAAQELVDFGSLRYFNYPFGESGVLVGILFFAFFLFCFFVYTFYGYQFYLYIY